MKKDDGDLNKYAQMGLAALIPGMQRMIELMQHELDMMRERLTGLQEPRKKTGRPPKAIAGEKLASGWPADPEERKAEARRRMQNRDSKRRQRAAKAAKSMVSKDSPDHDKFRKKMKQAAKRRWANMSFKERKAKLAAMRAGRKQKKAPVLKLEAVS
jgi:hypothetical protein